MRMQLRESFGPLHNGTDVSVVNAEERRNKKFCVREKVKPNDCIKLILIYSRTVRNKKDEASRNGISKFDAYILKPFVP
jgi:hypothetical protein